MGERKENSIRMTNDFTEEPSSNLASSTPSGSNVGFREHEHHFEQNNENLGNNEENEEKLDLNEKDILEKEQEAKKLMKEGKFGIAANIWSQCLAFRCRKFGETAPICADTYYNYGKCLLSQAQDEFDVLGGVIKQNVAKKIFASLPTEIENKSAKKGIMVESHYDTNEGDEEDQESNKEEEDIEVSQIESVIEDASDILELAWQNLEVARVIYSLDPNEKLKLADVHLLIGDISMESDNMQQAVNEYEKCLQIRQELLSDPNSRLLADAHFSLGLALQHQGKLSVAIEQFRLAKTILETRLSTLNEQMKSEKTDSLEKEIKQIFDIVQELSNKIEDLEIEVSETVLIQPPTGSSFSESLETFVPAATTTTASSLLSSTSSSSNDVVVHKLTVKRKLPDITSITSTSLQEKTERESNY